MNQILLAAPSAYAPGMLDFLIHGDFIDFFLIAFVLIAAISLHEYGHALADEMQGDPTARLAGRLTVNPVAHLDPFGTLMIVLVGFGWGKPVPISPANMRDRRFGAAVVGIAGPAVNLLLAIAGALVARVLRIPLFVGFGAIPGLGFVSRLAAAWIYINVLLVILNLIPIPPLDGSRVLSALLPADKQKFIFFMDKWGFLILLGVAFFVLPNVLPPIATSVDLWLLRLVGYPGA